jgi:uncharacterized caspase-like protein
MLGQWRLLIPCALLIGLLAHLPATAAERIALVIGNSDYGHVPDLANPARDAALIGEKLKQLDFKTASLENLTQAQLKSAISDFTAKISQAGPEAIAVFYFAGHGVQIDGTNYLIPVDAAIATESDVILHAVSASDLLKTLELAKAKANIVILDA